MCFDPTIQARELICGYFVQLSNSDLTIAMAGYPASGGEISLSNQKILTLWNRADLKEAAALFNEHILNGLERFKSYQLDS